MFKNIMRRLGAFVLDKLKAFGRGFGLTRKQKVWLCILFAIMVPVVLYLGGFAGQVMYEHDRWVKSGGIASTLKTEYPNVHPQYCFHYALYSPYGHKGIQLLLVVAAGLGIYALIRTVKFRKGWDKERQFRQSQSGTYGTSGWMEPDEQQQVFETAAPSLCEGIILGEQKGKAVCLPTWTGFNRHIAVYGAPGVGKSRCFVINHILQSARRGESIVVTDSKIDGGLYATTALYLESLGYTVRIFNLVIPECSDSWNCLSEIRGDQARAQMFVDVIMKNTSEGKIGRVLDELREKPAPGSCFVRIAESGLYGNAKEPRDGIRPAGDEFRRSARSHLQCAFGHAPGETSVSVI